MRLLANPIVLRALVVLFCSVGSFLAGLIFIRLLRKNIAQEADLSSAAAGSLQSMPMHVYNDVIHQLKQQLHDLQLQSQAEQQRSRANDALHQAVLASLPCGVLVFGTNGLVKTCSPAAKQLLGFASTSGMAVEDIFREALVTSRKQAQLRLIPAQPDRMAHEVSAALREDGEPRELQGEYLTPAGERKVLALTISPVRSADGSRFGVACGMMDIGGFAAAAEKDAPKVAAQGAGTLA